MWLNKIKNVLNSMLFQFHLNHIEINYKLPAVVVVVGNVVSHSVVQHFGNSVAVALVVEQLLYRFVEAVVPIDINIKPRLNLFTPK